MWPIVRGLFDDAFKEDTNLKSWEMICSRVDALMCRELGKVVCMVEWSKQMREITLLGC
jgi:hypothetical protein